MKIVKGSCDNHKTVADIREGGTMRFVNTLANKHKVGDVFMRMEVCNTYEPRDYTGNAKYPGKIGVVNLRSGALAWVHKTRSVYSVDAEVCVA